MTVRELLKRVKDRSRKGDPNVTGDYTTLEMLRAINDARRDLIRYVPKQFLRKDAVTPLSLVNPTVLYSLASDVMEPIIFRYTFGGVEYVLQRIESEREYYITLFIRTQAPNRPFFYVEKGLDSSGNRQIEVYPTPLPANTYTVNYTYYKDASKTDVTLTDIDSEFPDFPSYMQDALWKGSLYYFMAGHGGMEGVAIAKTDYEAAKIELDKIEEEDQDMDIVWRWGFSRPLYRDPTTGIRLQ